MIPIPSHSYTIHDAEAWHRPRPIHINLLHSIQTQGTARDRLAPGARPPSILVQSIQQPARCQRCCGWIAVIDAPSAKERTTARAHRHLPSPVSSHATRPAPTTTGACAGGAAGPRTPAPVPAAALLDGRCIPRDADAAPLLPQVAPARPAPRAAPAGPYRCRWDRVCVHIRIMTSYLRTSPDQTKQHSGPSTPSPPCRPPTRQRRPRRPPPLPPHRHKQPRRRPRPP